MNTFFLSADERGGTANFRLHRRRIGRVELRPPLGAEAHIVGSPLLHSWALIQTQLKTPAYKAAILIDEELVGYCTMAQGTAEELAQFSSLTTKLKPGGHEWALAGALAIDRRLFQSAFSDVMSKTLSICGPELAALYARRVRSRGYLASLCLTGYGAYAGQMCPNAYIQQVWAGSIDEPGLEAHLRFGAHIIGVDESTPTPQALLAWHDPYG